MLHFIIFLQHPGRVGAGPRARWHKGQLSTGTGSGRAGGKGEMALTGWEPQNDEPSEGSKRQELGSPAQGRQQG